MCIRDRLMTGQKQFWSIVRESNIWHFWTEAFSYWSKTLQRSISPWWVDQPYLTWASDAWSTNRDILFTWLGCGGEDQIMPNYIFLCKWDFLLLPLRSSLLGVVLDSVESSRLHSSLYMHSFTHSFIHLFSNISSSITWSSSIVTHLD